MNDGKIEYVEFAQVVNPELIEDIAKALFQAHFPSRNWHTSTQRGHYRDLAHVAMNAFMAWQMKQDRQP